MKNKKLLKLVHERELPLTNISSIDKEHQKIKNKILDLHKHYDGHKVQEGFSASVASIFDELHHHFIHEEEIMKIIAFPNIEDHKKEHRIIIEKIYKYTLQLNNEPKKWTKLYNKITHDLLKWFFNHINDFDLKYAEYIEKNNINTENIENGDN